MVSLAIGSVINLIKYKKKGGTKMKVQEVLAGYIEYQLRKTGQ